MSHVARTLYNSVAAGAGSPLTASGDSTAGGTGPVLDLRYVTDVALSVTAGTPTGTSPTLMVQVDMLDACGNWILGVVKLSANITASGTYQAYGGLHIGSTAAVVLTDRGRVSWTVGGTSPSFPAQISLIGR